MGEWPQLEVAESDNANTKRQVGARQVCEGSEVRESLGVEGRGLDPGRWDRAKAGRDQRGKWEKEILSGCLAADDVCRL